MPGEFKKQASGSLCGESRPTMTIASQVILQGCLIFFFGSFLWNLSEKSRLKYRFLLRQCFIYLIPPPSVLTSANRNILTDDMSCIPEQAQLFLNFTY